MNHFLKIIGILFCFMQATIASSIKFEQVFEPDFALYESLFFKVGYGFCENSCNPAVLDQILNYTFYQEAAAYLEDSSQRVLVHAVLFDEVIGYMSCEFMPDHQLYIHHLIIDPEMYHDLLVKDFLFLVFEIMPKVKLISISVPACCTDLINLLEDLGFVSSEQICITDQAVLTDSVLYVQYDFPVSSKCAMCNVLYGPNFWEQDEDVEGMSDSDDENDGAMATNHDVGQVEIYSIAQDIYPLDEK